MLKLLALSLVAVAMSQLIRPINLFLDQVEGFRVEYDDQHNIILLVSDTECFIVEAPDASWDPLVRDQEHLHANAVAIVKLSKGNTSNSGVTQITQVEAIRAYESSLERFQCSRKTIYTVDYSPTPD